jgi:hypothetical protein
MRVTIRQYCKSFKSLQGMFAAVPLVSPLAGFLLHEFAPNLNVFSAYLYPPLGDVDPLALAGTVCLLLLAVLVVYFCCEILRRVHASVPILLWCLCAVGICALIGLYSWSVRIIPVPSENMEVAVSVGYQRTDFGLQTYPGWSDQEMLHDRGPWEEQIQKLWTHRSIAVARALLWLSYTLALTCALVIVSLAVYQDASEQASGEQNQSGQAP